MSIVQLGDLVSIQTGKLDANASSPDGAYPFFTCAREPLKIANWKYDLDAILVAGNGDLNVKHYNGKFDAYQRTYILSAKNGNVDTRYLYHFLDKYLDRLREQSIGGIIKYIKLGMLTEAPVPLPPLDEQKRIASILDQADDLRRKRKRAIDRLNKLGQAIFHEMFGDSSKPEGWSCPTSELSLVCEKITDGTHQSPKWAESGIPFIFVSNVRNRKIDLETKKFVSQDEYENLTKNAKIEEGDVLYTCVGSYGHTAVVDGEEPFVFQRHIAHLKPRRGAVDSTFLAWALETPILKRQADRTATGIAQKTVTLKALKSFEIPLPNMDQQLLFSQRMTELEAELAAMQLHYSAQNALMASLQHRAFHGGEL